MLERRGEEEGEKRREEKRREEKRREEKRRVLRLYDTSVFPR